jgi:hypothetical protein
MGGLGEGSENDKKTGLICIKLIQKSQQIIHQKQK